jgi:hypothetical protein
MWMTGRAALAADAAEALVADLVTAAADRSDGDLTDDLCTRIGTVLHAQAQGPVR